jgi:hypothetical protein
MLCFKDGSCCGNDTLERGIGGSVATTRKLSEHARGGSMTRRRSVWFRKLRLYDLIVGHSLA